MIPYPSNLRGIFPVDHARALVVCFDEDLYNDPDYAPGVYESLCKAYDEGDHFVVYLVGASGEILDSIHSMAGYGGAKEAAEAALRDHFGGREPLSSHRHSCGECGGEGVQTLDWIRPNTEHDEGGAQRVTVGGEPHYDGAEHYFCAQCGMVPISSLEIERRS